MRITLVSPHDPLPPLARDARGEVGGVERVIGSLAQGLAARGHDVKVLCSTSGPPSESVRDGVRVVRSERRLTVMRAPVASLAQRLEGTEDIVQVAGVYPFTTAPVLARAHRLGVPSVLDFHFEPAPTGRFGRAAATAYRTTAARRYRLADAAFVRSLAYGKGSPSLASVPRERWRVVPNGIDPERFRVRTRGSGGYLLFVGRLVPYKGLDLLLRACALKDPGMPIVVAGDGPMFGRWEQLSRKLGLDVRFLGRVSDDALPRLYGGARLTVLPSLTRQESFGITLIESMACGTPVLASDLPGVSELALQGGAVAASGSVKAWAHALRKAIQPDALPRGAAIANPVRARYAWDSIVARVEAEHEAILGRRRAPEGPEVTPVAHPRGQSVL